MGHPLPPVPRLYILQTLYKKRMNIHMQVKQIPSEAAAHPLTNILKFVRSYWLQYIIAQ